MRKFLAVVKREYFKIVWSWAFIIGTLLAPLIASMFAVVPALMFSIKGDAQRIAIVDQSGRVGARLKENLSAERILEKAREATKESFKNVDVSQEERMQRSAEQFGESFIFEDFTLNGKTLETARQELSERIKQNDLDAYLIIPENFEADDTKFEFYARNSGDFIANSSLENALNEAIRSERLAKANISEEKLRELGKKVELNVTKVSERGEQAEEGGGFIASFIIGLLIYLTLAIYGQMILGAVVEEKETRIAEILFSSAKPFQLMLGKLVGVGLAGLTQLTIWMSSLAVLLIFGLSSARAMGIPLTIPDISPVSVI